MTNFETSFGNFGAMVGGTLDKGVQEELADKEDNKKA